MIKYCEYEDNSEIQWWLEYKTKVTRLIMQSARNIMIGQSLIVRATNYCRPIIKSIVCQLRNVSGNPSFLYDSFINHVVKIFCIISFWTFGSRVIMFAIFMFYIDPILTTRTSVYKSLLQPVLELLMKLPSLCSSRTFMNKFLDHK